MEKKQYEEIVKKHLPDEKKGKNLIKAFICGGLMGVLANFLIAFYQSLCHVSAVDASVLMIVTVIFLSCLATSLGFFDNIVNFGKAGFIIPISGFASSVQSATLDYKKEGLITGIGSNVFKLAGSVILYGVSSAIIISLVRYLIGVLA